MSRFDLWQEAYRKGIEFGLSPKTARAFADRFVAKHLKESA